MLPRSSIGALAAAALLSSIVGAPAFDFAFLDPPYGTGLAEKALGALAAGGWLAEGAVAVVERGWRDAAEAPEGYEALDDREWGAARVSFLRRLG